MGAASAAGDRFDRLVGRLDALCAGDDAVELRLLPERQLVVRKGMVAAQRDGSRKAGREAPAAGGYEIFVASRDAERAESNPPALQTLGATRPDEPADLRLTEGERERTWSLVGPSGESIAVRLRAGDGASAAELSNVLALVREALFARSER